MHTKLNILTRHQTGKNDNIGLSYKITFGLN